jgi:hypothetical protein
MPAANAAAPITSPLQKVVMRRDKARLIALEIAMMITLFN